MHKRLLLIFASAILASGMVFAACDDDDDVLDDAGTEVSDILDGDETEETDADTPAAGGDQQRTQERARECPTFEAGATPDPEATIPAGCPTPAGGDDDETPEADATP